MELQPDFIYLPAFAAGQGQFFEELRSRASGAVQVLSHYMRYNEVTLASAVIGINWGLITLADKVMGLGSLRFFRLPDRLEQFLDRPFVQFVNSQLFKSICAVGGLSAVNALMNLQLSWMHIAISVIATLALKILYQKVFSPEVSLWGDEAKVKKGEAKSPSLVVIEETPDKTAESVSKGKEASKQASGKGKSELKVAPEVMAAAILDESTPKVASVDKKEETTPPLPLEAGAVLTLTGKESHSDSSVDILDDSKEAKTMSEIMSDKVRIAHHRVPSSATESLLATAVFGGNLAGLADW